MATASVLFLVGCGPQTPSEQELRSAIDAGYAGIAQIQADRVRSDAEFRASMIEMSGQPTAQRAIQEAHIEAERAIVTAEHALAEGYRKQIDDATRSLCVIYGKECGATDHPNASQRPAEPAPAR